MDLYSDRHGIFRVNLGEARDDLRSQFGRALATLGIGSICVAIAPVDAQDAHVSHSPADDLQLRQIVAKHYPRKLSNTLSCQFHSTLLQIEPSAAGGSNLRGAAVTVVEQFDHSCQVLWRHVVLPHSTVQKMRAAPLV